MSEQQCTEQRTLEGWYRFAEKKSSGDFEMLSGYVQSKIEGMMDSFSPALRLRTEEAFTETMPSNRVQRIVNALKEQPAYLPGEARHYLTRLHSREEMEKVMAGSKEAAL